MCKTNEVFKYFAKDDGREVKMGDDAVIQITMTLDDENIEKLLKYGLIEKKRVKTIKDIPSDYHFYVDELQKTLGWSEEMTYYMISGFVQVRPSTVFQLLLKEIALWIEHNIDDKPLIENETIFIFDIPNGEIHEISTKGLKNYSTFAGFSRYEYAEKAKKILKDIYNRIYG